MWLTRCGLRAPFCLHGETVKLAASIAFLKVFGFAPVAVSSRWIFFWPSASDQPGL